jgi:hypothetical protein
MVRRKALVTYGDVDRHRSLRLGKETLLSELNSGAAVRRWIHDCGIDGRSLAELPVVWYQRSNIQVL